MLALGYPATFTETTTGTGETVRTMLDAGTNPATGVVVTYALQQPADEVRLRFLDAQGQLVGEFSSQTPPVLSATTPSVSHAWPGSRRTPFCVEHALS